MYYFRCFQQFLFDIEVLLILLYGARRCFSYCNYNFKRNYKMNKNELINSISATSGLTKTDSAKALDAFISTVSTALKSGNNVRLVGFGTFATTKRSATTAINPRTRQTVKVPARNVAKFKAGKALQNVVNNKK